MPVPVQAVVGIRRNGSAFSASAVHVHLLLGLRRAIMSPSVAAPTPPANSPEIEAPARTQTPGSVPRQQQQQQQHVLVVGGGLVGLTIAQGLKRRGIPCTVFERDAGQHGRLQGWSITIHWGLSALEQVLPREVFDELISVGRSLHS